MCLCYEVNLKYIYIYDTIVVCIVLNMHVYLDRHLSNSTKHNTKRNNTQHNPTTTWGGLTKFVVRVTPSAPHGQLSPTFTTMYVTSTRRTVQTGAPILIKLHVGVFWTYLVIFSMFTITQYLRVDTIKKKRRFSQNRV